MSVVVIEYEGMPRPKERPRANRNGVFYTPKKTRQYEKDLGWLARAAMVGKPMLEGEIAIRITAMVPNPLAPPDWDNIAKAVCDALQGICYHDDAHITEAAVYKRQGPIPRLRIELAAIASEAVEAFKPLDPIPMIGEAA